MITVFQFQCENFLRDLLCINRVTFRLTKKENRKRKLFNKNFIRNVGTKYSLSCEKYKFPKLVIKCLSFQFTTYILCSLLFFHSYVKTVLLFLWNRRGIKKKPPFHVVHCTLNEQMSFFNLKFWAFIFPSVHSY